MIKIYLIQKKWYRDLLEKRTFYLSNGKWKEMNDFKKGEKVERVDNGCKRIFKRKWNT